MHKILLLFILVSLLKPLHLDAQYTVMFSDDYPPYNYTNNNGELVGFNIDILNAIQDLYKLEITIEGNSWKTINSALDSNNTDAIGGAHYPGIPDIQYLYTRSTLTTSHCFLYNSNHFDKFSLEKLRSLKEPKVAMWDNDVLIHYVQSINPSAKIILINNYDELIKELENKEITCIFAQRVGSMYQAKLLGKDFIHSLDHRILERNMGFKISKSTPQLAEYINNGLEVILANGKYQQIYDKWIPKYNKSQNELSKYIRYSLIGGGIILTLFLLTLIANYLLQTKIKNKTRDLQLQLKLNSTIMVELEQQKLKAEESDRMKSAFLANMSHEIRTPMNGILGFTELLKTVDFSSEKRSQFIDIIQQSGHRMLSTINNIIDVSKLQCGIEKFDSKKIQPKSILYELRDFFEHEAETKGLILSLLEKVPSSTKAFYTDEYKLNSILTNLIKNAIKYTLKGEVEIAYLISDSKAEFWVKDSGIGIPKDKQASIFEQFVQAELPHSIAVEGSGLGLSISRGYIELMQGEIKLTSTEGIGSVFYFSIPNLGKK